MARKNGKAKKLQTRDHFIAFCEDVLDICEDEFLRAMADKDTFAQEYYDELAIIVESWLKTAQTASNNAVKRTIKECWGLDGSWQYSTDDHVWFNDKYYLPLWEEYPF